MAWLEGAREAAGRPLAPRLSPQALAVLQAYGWPGNLRELGAVLESALLRCEGPSIELGHLPLEHLVDSAVAPASPRRYGGARR